MVFQASKQLLLSSQVLVHFDPNKELILSCDALAYGIGAVLSHKMPDGSERPIGFVSRTLSSAKKNYSQIEKEGLACVFGVKRFHSYLYGHHFSLITDHKPLLNLFNEQQAVPPQASDTTLGSNSCHVRVQYILSIHYSPSKCRCNEPATTSDRTQTNATAP